MQRNTTLPCQLSSLIQTKFWPQPTFKWAHGAHVKEFMAPTSLQAAHLWWHIIWLNLIERYQYTLWLGPSFSVTRPYFQWDCRACVKNLVWNKTTISLEKELMLDHGRGKELLVKEALPIILEEEHFNWDRGLDHSDEKARREEQSLLTFDLEWP